MKKRKFADFSINSFACEFLTNNLLRKKSRNKSFINMLIVLDLGLTLVACTAQNNEVFH